MYKDNHANYWKKYLNTNKLRLLKLLKQNRKYYNGCISKFYRELKNKTQTPEYVKRLKKIWEGRDVIIVEGENVKFGAGNGLLNNSKSIKRIICPSSHSFDIYDKILEAVLKFNKNNNLILISLGPAATVLSFDLCKLGYQAIDIGHTDRDYELFIRNENKWIFNGEQKDLPENYKETYNKEIINRITIK